MENFRNGGKEESIETEQVNHTQKNTAYISWPFLYHLQTEQG